MKEILNMMRFDYITVKKMTVPYVIGFMAISLVLASFSIPIGIASFVITLCIFAPLELTCDSDTKKIYGVLPVRRCSVIRAWFAELILSLLVGELFMILFMFISKLAPLYDFLPDKMKSASGVPTTFNPDKNNIGLDFGQMMFLIILIFTYLFIMSVYLKMINEISGQDSSIRHLLIILTVTAVIFAIVMKLSFNEKIPPLKSYIPSTAGEKVAVSLILNAVSLVAGFICCELTVKKTTNREI